MVKYTLVNSTHQPIEVALSANGGGTGTTSRYHIAAGKSYTWERKVGNIQTFSAKIGDVNRVYKNKNPGSYELKKNSVGDYLLF
jgi:hypothetical protein